MRSGCPPAVGACAACTLTAGRSGREAPVGAERAPVRRPVGLLPAGAGFSGR